MRKVLIGLGLAGALGLAGMAGMAAAQGGGWGPGGGPRMGDRDGPRGGWGPGGGPGGGWHRGGPGGEWRGGDRGGPPWMRGEMGQRRGFARGRMMLQRGFEHFDRNLDGVVEWSEAQQVLGLAFNRLDQDGDGAITRADIEARISRRMERFQRFAERSGLSERRAEIANRAVERFMGRFGKPADGRVTREEYVAQFEPLFRMINRTGDGRITREQVEEFLAFMRMVRG